MKGKAKKKTGLFNLCTHFIASIFILLNDNGSFLLSKTIEKKTNFQEAIQKKIQRIQGCTNWFNAGSTQNEFQVSTSFKLGVNRY